jgi:hypothetical protein
MWQDKWLDGENQCGLWPNQNLVKIIITMKRKSILSWLACFLFLFAVAALFNIINVSKGFDFFASNTLMLYAKILLVLVFIFLIDFITNLVETNSQIKSIVDGLRRNKITDGVFSVVSFFSLAFAGLGIYHLEMLFDGPHAYLIKLLTSTLKLGIILLLVTGFLIAVIFTMLTIDLERYLMRHKHLYLHEKLTSQKKLDKKLRVKFLQLVFLVLFLIINRILLYLFHIDIGLPINNFCEWLLNL